MSKLWDWLTGLFGTAFFIALMIFGLLSLPFSVIALVRWFEMSWWMALIVAMFITAIPFVGQIAFIILAVMGAYYFVMADYSFENSANSGQQITYNSKFSKSLYKTCLRDKPLITYLKKSNNSDKINSFCRCYSESIALKLSKEDIKFVKKYGNTSKRMEQIKLSAVILCTR